MKLFRALGYLFRRWYEDGFLAVLLVLGTTLGIPVGLVLLFTPADASKTVRHLTFAGGVVTMLGAWIVLWRVLASRKRLIDDTTFGQIESSDGIACHGLVEQQGGIRVTVFADKLGPTEQQRKLFTQLMKRLEEVQRSIEGPLYEEYRLCRTIEKAHYEKQCPELIESFETDFPQIENPKQIWEIAQLTAVTVCGDDQMDIVLSYHIDWGDPEHDLCAHVKDWKVLEVGKEG